MNLLAKICSYCGVAILLSSCSSAVFPEVIEDEDTVEAVSEDTAFTTKQGGKIELSMPEEANSLTSDEKNVAYEDDDPELKSAMKKISVTDTENAAPAKTKPVTTKEIAQTTTDKPQEADAKLTSFSEDEVSNKAVSSQELASALEENSEPSVSYRIETIYFNNGGANVDSQYNSRIREIARLAKSKPHAKIRVLGFASSRTRNTDIVSHKLANFKVSADRAQNVAKALQRQGLKASQIETEALSDTAPVYQEVMPEGERLNRRAEIYISY